MTRIPLPGGDAIEIMDPIEATTDREPKPPTVVASPDRTQGQWFSLLALVIVALLVTAVIVLFL